MIPGSIRPIKSSGENFTHGVGILDHIFKTASNILDMFSKIKKKKVIVVVQIHLCNHKIFERRVVNMF